MNYQVIKQGDHVAVGEVKPLDENFRPTGGTKQRYVYKIRDKNTGLYSNGGTTLGFTRDGKTWSSIGSFKCHITNYLDDGYNKPPKPFPPNWEIVEIVQNENTISYEELLAK